MPFNLRLKTDPPAGIGTSRDGGRVDVGASRLLRVEPGGAAAPPLDGKQIVERRHVDWLEHQIRWRWLLDSYEGGERYRNAVYGPDRKGMPCRNLFRHRREYPDPQQFPSIYQGFAGASTVMLSGTTAAGTGIGPWPGMLGADPAATAQDDDYELRRARTPVPEFVAEAVEIHLGKVYAQEVAREGPEDLTAWWEDVDGRGTCIDDWMAETVAPLLLVLGCLDIVLDHPQAPPGEQIATRADEQRLGLDTCVASYILPQNMVWWKCDAAGRYTECLVREYTDSSDRMDLDKKGNAIDPEDKGSVGENWRRRYVRYRLWRADESILFNYNGDEILERVPHPFGRVPIVRLIDIRKHRTPTIGKSRYEAIAELQREYYNRDSELILSDTLQAHPFLSGAEDFCKADNTLSVGPGYVLPKKKNPDGTAYEGWEFVSPPKDPAESLRQNKDDLVEMKDRRACLIKPAGAAGSGAGTVSQSGVSKQLDANTGHKLLVAIAKSLAKAERQIAEYAKLVLRNGAEPAGAAAETVEVSYPARFELNDAATLITGTTQLQLILGNVGNAPNTERELIQATIRQLLVGLDDEVYEQMDDEIELLVETKAALKEQVRELPEFDDRAAGLVGRGTDEARGGVDPTGQSAGTMISNVIPAIV
jgi:hypothetical protein